MSANVVDPVALCREVDDARLRRQADLWRHAEPRTIVAEPSPDSPGTPHEYYSEGDYWWPDPESPGGPYIRRDGLTNPGNFDNHRILLRRFSMAVPALTASALHLEDATLAARAVQHLRAWFVDLATRMEPHLEYGQAIRGICKGRGIGIVDTVHLAEVAVATQRLEEIGALAGEDRAAVRAWFRKYMFWLLSSPHGIEERDHGNNHSTCWAMQVAAFAALLGEEVVLDSVHRLYNDFLLQQIEPDGRMPLELERTRPYNYSFFNLELFGALLQSLSASRPQVWLPAGGDPRTARALEFLLPHAADPVTWPHGRDVAYIEHYPIRWSALLFLGLGHRIDAAVAAWQQLPPDSDNPEIQRNTPVRQPMLWWVGGPRDEGRWRMDEG